LSPLHNTINHFLKQLPMDGTFNQQAVAAQVRDWTKLGYNKELFCYDLTTATDRIPIVLQERILSILMASTSFGNGWKEILTGRTFLTENGDHISYATGQPMGARSSFPMLALTHHVIIQIAAKRAELEVYREYVIVGDDSTITSALVSTQYHLLMNRLGVPINLTKSIGHVDGAVPLAEICKRIFMDGVEISVFNPKLIVRTIHDGRLGPDLQNDLHLRGWNPSESVFWNFMAGILDTENLALLMKLNIAPMEITGLHSQVRPGSALDDVKAWVPSFPDMNNNHIIELFTWVSASEQLKRLDAILRATVTINDSLSILAAANANPKAIPQFVRDSWLDSTLTEEERKFLSELILDVGPITPNHPIVAASRAEANRISELLHQLNALDSNMVVSARQGLLDAFRTSVSSIWLGSDTRVTQQNRALFTRTLNTLVSLFTSNKRETAEGRNLTLNYSVVLQTIGRLWSVSLVFGGRTTVNALRAGVTRNINASASILSSVVKGLSIVPVSSEFITPSKKVSAQTYVRPRRGRL
jgi:hypothetical protein